VSHGSGKDASLLSDRTTFFASPIARQAPEDEDLVHFLVVTEGLEPGHIVELGDGALTLGRTAPADVVLADFEVSRAHCRVDLYRGELIVTDLNSTNGTFVDGAKVTGSAVMKPGSTLQVGRHVLRHARRSRRELEHSRELDRSLERASQYVQSLLPQPLTSGAVRTDWMLLPSVRLGGDAFGYQWLDADAFAMYLLDVSGHGAESAMLAVSVLNVIRKIALPRTDFREPGQVLGELNKMFPMESHGSMFFTMWYGVYQPSTRTLRYASAGHHPAYLVAADRLTSMPLVTRSLGIGMMDEVQYEAQTTTVPPGATLYVFSDGVFEVMLPDGNRWTLDDFLPLISATRQAGVPEPRRLYEHVHRVARRGPLDDDFSLLTLDFA
jgi:serine phosphatase RsbU (regulator of sigma subunit)